MGTKLHYWYAAGEEKERKADIEYIRRNFPKTEFEVMPDLGHAGLALQRPELFAEMLGSLN